MSLALGNFDIGKTIRFRWPTFAAAGESITRSTAGTVRVYSDVGSSVVGVTDTLNNEVTGVHLCVIDLSADFAFYTAQTDFDVQLEGATIDGKVVNAPIAHFSILNRSAGLSLAGAVVADAGNTATTFLTDLPSTVDDFYRFSYIKFKSGALAEQVRPITSYVGTTKFLVLQEALVGSPDGTPDGGDRFIIINA